MTIKKDLKKRVRARQQQTGERYTAALAQVKRASSRRSRPAIVELPDVSTLAAAAGLRCKAYCSPSLWKLGLSDEVRGQLMTSVLGRLTAVLRVTGRDSRNALLRAALLHGRPPSESKAAFGLMSGSFVAGLRLGVRGTSEDGRAIAFEAPDPRSDVPLVLVATLWPSRAREPLLYLALASDWLNATPFLEGLVDKVAIRVKDD